MKRFVFHALLATSFVLGLAACKQKDDPVPQSKFNNVKLEFSNVVDNQALELDTKWYVNAANDSFQVSAYKYYISNIVLKTADGKSYAEQNSYHLIDQENAGSRKITLTNVPVGEYTSISFLIGVDSALNTQGAQDGDLSPTKGMLWDWNTGYIMAKMEGQANTSPRTARAFTYHISGFSGEYNALTTRTLAFPTAAIVSGNNIPNVHIFSNVQEWFRNPQTFSIANYNMVMNVSDKSKMIADNYADMFSVDHIDN